EEIRRAVADAGLWAGVRSASKAERVLVPVGRLLGVPDPQLDVIPAVQWHEIVVLRHGQTLLGSARGRRGAATSRLGVFIAVVTSTHFCFEAARKDVLLSTTAWLRSMAVLRSPVRGTGDAPKSRLLQGAAPHVS